MSFVSAGNAGSKGCWPAGLSAGMSVEPPAVVSLLKAAVLPFNVLTGRNRSVASGSSNNAARDPDAVASQDWNGHRCWGWNSCSVLLTVTGRCGRASLPLACRR